MRDWPLERLESVAGTRDVEYVADLSLVVVVVGLATRDVLQPRTIIRIESQYLVETAEDPDNWYMGQLVGDEIVCWGQYGTLERALGSL